MFGNMSECNLQGLTHLNVGWMGAREFIGHSYRETIHFPFLGVPRLRHLRLWSEWLYVMQEVLDVSGWELLSFGLSFHGAQRWDSEVEIKKLFQLFKKLELLDVSNCVSYNMVTMLMTMLLNGNLSTLHTLKISKSPLRAPDLAQIYTAMRQGNLQQVKSLRLCECCLLDDSIDELVEMMPLLKKLDVTENFFTAEGKARLEAAASLWMGGGLVLEI